jgi:hypothetical protein
MPKVQVGGRFGSLVVMSLYVGARKTGAVRRMALCRCDCGGDADVEKYNLSSGNTTQCNACATESRALKRRRHGHSHNAEGRSQIEAKCYYTWQAMKQRCLNPGDARFKDYGGRGVRVCGRWRASYTAFLSDMGLPPSMSHQIDRSDNDGNYEPSNCAWVDREENNRNKRNSRNITAHGKTQTLVEWAAEVGVKRETIARRMQRGMSPEEALNPKMRKPGRPRPVTCPAGTFDSISGCARAVNLSTSAVFGRIHSSSYPDWRYTA